MSMGQKGWDMEVLNDLCNERDRGLILRVPLPRCDREDSWYWLFDNNGEFTVKSCYRRIQGDSQGHENGFWKKVWSLQMPGKILNFLWRVCHKVLPTALELAKKCVNISSVCSVCNVQVEDASHVLFTCNAARELWRGLGEQSLLRVGEGESVREVLKREFMHSNKQRCVMIGLHCWGLWYRRNVWVWERTFMPVFGVRSMVTNLLQDWRKSQDVAGAAGGRLGST